MKTIVLAVLAVTLGMSGTVFAQAETPVIDQPHAVVYGTSVPGPFWASMSHENVTEGLLGRFLPFESGYASMQSPC